MSITDLAVLGGIALIAAMPLVTGAVTSAVARLSPAPLPAPTAEEASQKAWRQEWTVTLISLLGDLEKEEMSQGAKLCRELMWEIIGGEPEVAKK